MLVSAEAFLVTAQPKCASTTLLKRLSVATSLRGVQIIDKRAIAKDREYCKDATVRVEEATSYQQVHCIETLGGFLSTLHIDPILMRKPVLAFADAVLVLRVLRDSHTRSPDAGALVSHRAPCEPGTQVRYGSCARVLSAPRRSGSNKVNRTQRTQRTQQTRRNRVDFTDCLFRLRHTIVIRCKRQTNLATDDEDGRREKQVGKKMSSWGANARGSLASKTPCTGGTPGCSRHRVS